MNASTQYNHISSIWNTSLNNYALVSEYCSALELAASSFSASGPSEFPCFNSHLLAIIALMGLLASYKFTQHNILSKNGQKCLTLDSIKLDLLNEECLPEKPKQEARTSMPYKYKKRSWPKEAN